MNFYKILNELILLLLLVTGILKKLSQSSSFYQLSALRFCLPSVSLDRLHNSEEHCFWRLWGWLWQHWKCHLKKLSMRTFFTFNSTGAGDIAWPWDICTWSLLASSAWICLHNTRRTLDLLLRNSLTKQYSNNSNAKKTHDWRFAVRWANSGATARTGVTTACTAASWASAEAKCSANGAELLVSTAVSWANSGATTACTAAIVEAACWANSVEKSAIVEAASLHEPEPVAQVKLAL